MKSQRTWIVAFSLLSLTSSPAFSAPLNLQGEDLRQKIIQLYESSRTPYPMEENAIRSTDDRGIFEGCTIALQDGTIQDGLSSIVTYQITREEGHGPLSPPVVTRATQLMGAWLLKEAIAAGAVFRKGILDLDPVTFASTADTSCQPPLSARDSWSYTSSGVSSDGFSYESRGFCRDGKLRNRQNSRLSSGYLVAKNSAGEYSYCWK